MLLFNSLIDLAEALRSLSAVAFLFFSALVSVRMEASSPTEVRGSRGNADGGCQALQRSEESNMADTVSDVGRQPDEEQTGPRLFQEPVNAVIHHKVCDKMSDTCVKPQLGSIILRI